MGRDEEDLYLFPIIVLKVYYEVSTQEQHKLILQF